MGKIIKFYVIHALNSLLLMLFSQQLFIFRLLQ